MTEEHKQPQSEAQIPGSGEGPPPTPFPSTPPQPPASEVPTAPLSSEKPASPWRRRLRRFLWFLAGSLLLYVCGFLSAVLLVVQPLEGRYQQVLLREGELKAQLETTQQERDEALARVQELEQELQQWKEKVAEFEAAREVDTQVQAFIQAQRDIYKAIAALYEKDTLTARLALQGAAKAVEGQIEGAPEEIRDIVSDVHKALVDLLPQLTPTQTTIRRLQQMANLLDEVTDQIRR